MMNVSPIHPLHDPARDQDGAGELPRPTRLALWILLGFSLLMLLVLVEFQRKRTELALAQRQSAQREEFAQKEKLATGVILEEKARAAVAQEQPVALARLEPLDPSQWSSEMASAELVILRDLAENDWASEPRRTLKRLQPLLQHSDTTIQDGAQILRNSLDAILDGEARAQARGVAETAHELADSGEFAKALKILDEGQAQLPADAPFTSRQAVAIFDQLRAKFTRRREETRAALLGPEDAPNALEKAQASREHPDALVREEAERRLKVIAEKTSAARALRAENAQKSHEAWHRFLTAYRTAMLEGNAADAETYCDTPLSKELAFLLETYPSAMKGLREDASNLKKLQQAALKTPADKRQVDLQLRRGRVTGILEGTRRGQLSVALEGGAFVSVKVEQLSAAGFLHLLGDKGLNENNLRTAVWALSALENPADAPSFLAKNYGQLNQPVPEHWQLVFAVENRRVVEQGAARGFKELKAAVDANDPERTGKALDELKPSLAALSAFGDFSQERKELLRAAEKIAGRLQAKTVILQTGVLPSPVYKGILTDQISQYLDNQNKTDVGTQFGIKLGAHGGLQRVLLKLDGIEAAIGKARVKRATLELYQIESPKSMNAAVGLFRLKRPWVADAGTWRSFSDEKNSDWAVAGASGEDDITSREDDSVVLDSKKNVWRAFNVTRYVQDILLGKWQNNGFLLRVTNGEPDFHVRLYPETDVDQMKDPKFRPKLTLELEVDE